MKHAMKKSLRLACVCFGLACAAAAFATSLNAAEEPFRLELIRMEPQRPGVNVPQEEWTFRNVAPQRFTITLGPKNTYNPYEAEFKKIVKKEPEKFVSKYPFRGVAHLASKPYAFVLDQKEESSEGFDRLYFDLNGDGDLTDEKPLDAFEPPPPPKNPAEKKDGAKPAPKPRNVNVWSYFPRLDISLEVDGKKLDDSFFFSAYRQENKDYSYVMASLSAAAYRRGEITLDGKKRSVALVDNNSNGRFDDVLTMPKIPSTSRGRFMPSYGDALWIGPLQSDADDKAKQNPSQWTNHYLAKLIILDGKYYDVKASPLGDELSWTLSDTPGGMVESPHDSSTVVLLGDKASISLNLEKGKPAALPAGQWRILSYIITLKEPVKPEEKPAKDAPKKNPSQSSPSFIMAWGVCEMEPIEVRPGETAMLKFGPPFRTKVDVYYQPGQVGFSMSALGGQGEPVYTIAVGGQRPPRPEFTITDKKGEVVATGNFEYG